MILIGILGSSVDQFALALRRTPSFSRVVLLHDKSPKALDNRNEILRRAKGTGVAVETIELDAFDLIEDTVRIRQEIAKHDRTQLICKLTPGGGTLSAAALLACILEGVPCSYVRDGTDEEFRLPLLQVQYGQFINDKQRRVLDAIQTFKGSCRQSDLVRATKLSKPNINHHVVRLVKLGLIELQVDANDRRCRNIQLMPATSLLLGDARK